MASPNIEFTYKVPRMETIDKTAELYGLSSYQVRKLARSKRGSAFTVKIGSRYLINQEKFIAFLNCEEQEDNNKSSVQAHGVNQIQPIPVKL